MGDDDANILIWSEHQADLLRRLASGERFNDQIDWTNVIEEVSDVGRNTLRACRSHLLQPLWLDLKAIAWPLFHNVPHWRSESRIARINAADAFTPSMRQKIDVAELYVKALRALPSTIDGRAPLPLSDICPATLDFLLSES